MTIHMTRTAGILALGLTLLTAGPAIAQTQSGQNSQMPPAAAQSAPDFSQQQLQKFADAADRIRSIRQSAMQKIQQAGGKKEKTQVRKQTRRDMIGAIKDSGLTLKEYNQIARTARTHPKLAKKIQALQ